jgi:hypothetical protein
MLAEPLGKLLQASRRGRQPQRRQRQHRRPDGGARRRRRPDLLVQYSGYQSITPLVQPVAGFDPGRDLKPIGHLLDAPQVLVVRATSPPTPSRNSSPT